MWNYLILPLSLMLSQTQGKKGNEGIKFMVRVQETSNPQAIQFDACKVLECTDLEGSLTTHRGLRTQDKILCIVEPIPPMPWEKGGGANYRALQKTCQSLV